MDIVCTTCNYRGLARDELTETLEGAPRAGYKYIDVHEVDIPHTPEMAEAYGRQVRNACLSRGLEPVGIHAVGFGGKDSVQVDEHVARITTQIAFCQTLGGRYIVATGANARDKGPLENVIKCLRRLEPVIDGTPLIIGIEPHYGNVIERKEDYESIFADINNPQIGICPDIGHFHAAGVDVYEILAEFPDRIVYTHIKDHIGTQSVGLGRGEIDISRFVRALANIGYTGHLAVELEHKDKDNTQLYAEEALRYLEKCLSLLDAEEPSVRLRKGNLASD